jgi:hypothetical protein
MNCSKCGKELLDEEIVNVYDFIDEFGDSDPVCFCKECCNEKE